MENTKPKVGIGVLIIKDGKVLLGKRKGSHGEGDYAFPGGHLEHGESFEQCAKRETMEECGIEIKNVRFLLVANILEFMPKHYVHLTLCADWKEGTPTVKEPEKAENWGWHTIDNIPEPLFDMCKISLESYKSGKVYYDSE